MPATTTSLLFACLSEDIGFDHLRARGNLRSAYGLLLYQGASMGPRARARGNGISSNLFNCQRSLATIASGPQNSHLVFRFPAPLFTSSHQFLQFTSSRAPPAFPAATYRSHGSTAYRVVKT